MRIRVNFEKPEDICYIGHIDFTKVVTRGLRRTLLPLKFTEGFNSRVKVEMGFPLSVGMIGEDEYFDFYLRKDVDMELVQSKLEEAFKDIIKIKRIKPVQDNIPAITSLPAILVHFIYGTLEEVISENVVEEKLMSISEMQEIIVLRKKHNADKKKNIRPFIKEFKLLKMEQKNIVFLLSAYFSSNGSVKISEIEQILNENGIKVKFDYMIRKKTSVKYKGKLMSPFDIE